MTTAFVAMPTAMLSAHDFWLVPNAFYVAPGGSLEVLGQTGIRFPASESALPADRVAEARLIAATADERLENLSVSGTSLLIRHRPSTPGQRVVAISLVTRKSRTTPASFKRYVALEGAPELAEHYERTGLFPTSDSLWQQTTKFAKTIVEVGHNGARAFSRAAGHALELIPLGDPSSLQLGDEFAVRLVYRGKALPDAYLRVGMAFRGISGQGDANSTGGALPSAAPADTAIRTNSDGIAHIRLSALGLWNIRTLHAAALPGESVEWEVLFATLVFNVGGEANRPDAGRPADSARPSEPEAAQDSATAAGTVTRFHSALAAGDTSTVLSLLSDEVVILESGGVETRDDYRTHHLAADIEFARAVPSKPGSLLVRIRGDVAWVSGTSVTQGDFRGRPINSAGAELVVLTRESTGWKIRAVHWSSRTRRN